MAEEIRNENAKAELLIRLKKIEGQVRGLQKMIIDERGCRDILSQFSAIYGAMRQVSYHLMEHYLNKCIEKNEVQLSEDIMVNLKHFLKNLSR
ncbi:MAG: metal-sensitive transcriptional regulator [Thermodesulfovibrionales bacterium]